MSTHLELFDTTDTARIGAALAIRIAVFVREQGITLDEEIDEHDRTGSGALHVLAYGPDGTPVATGRSYRDADGVRIGRMAVLETARGQGYGLAVLDCLIARARADGYRRAVLWAQTHAIAFYERRGFAAFGEDFLDAGIPHRMMALDLVPGA